jgi:pilus assembly protein CpaB
LLANEEQSTLLAGFEANSVIHIVLVYRGDAETAQQFLTAQEKTLKSGRGKRE